MIAIIDYGFGNLHSVQNALTQLQAPSVITHDPDILSAADGLILPGVGAFPDAMRALSEARLIVPITQLARAQKPLLGICLGMQLLFESSTEFGLTAGLSLIPGHVMPIEAGTLKIPHIGWNNVHIHRPDALTRGTVEGDYFYFVHSYCANTPEENILLSTEYGQHVPALVRNPHLPVWGAQFHPEKSHRAGLNLLKNYVEIVSEGAKK